MLVSLSDMNTLLNQDILFSRSETLISKSSILLESMPWFLFLFIQVIAVAGTITELIFCVRLRLESLINVQMAITGSKKTLISRRPITRVCPRLNFQPRSGAEDFVSRSGKVRGCYPSGVCQNLQGEGGKNKYKIKRKIKL